MPIFKGCQSAAEALSDELGEEAVEQLGPKGVEALLNTRCNSSFLYKICGWDAQASKIVFDHHKEHQQREAEKAEQVLRYPAKVTVREKREGMMHMPEAGPLSSLGCP